jgi:hypothetical protein
MGKQVAAAGVWLSPCAGLLLDLAAQVAERGFWAGLWSFVFYFTSLSNMLVAVVAGRAAAGRRPSASLMGAVATYIAVVAIVYHLVLRNPQVPQSLSSTLLHTVTPLAYWAFWARFAPRGKLARSAALRWIAFPFAYVVYVLARGFVEGRYPYKFLDVNALGYGGVVMRAVVIGVLTLTLGFCVVALDRALSARAGRSG